jgi:enterobactin synthetase component F
VGDADRVRPLRAWHPAYLIYTAGTTGAPKGVAVAHHGLGPLREAAVAALHVQRGSVVLHNHAPVFDAHLLELLLAFGAGAQLVIQPPTVIAGDALAALLREHLVTHLLTTPTVLATLSPEQAPSLQTVVVGGEPCPQRLVDRWARHVALYNGYGPTETTVLACLTEAMAVGERVAVGRPLPTVQAIALDARLRPAPAGARAQLYIAGGGVALGYHGRPGATAARFVADPFDPGRRMYRTGDLVRIRADRVVEFLGRADAQLALRGRRVEPAEIEAALIAQPEIDRAAVAVTTSPELGDRLVGYVVVAEGQVLDAAAVSARLREVLPAALVPAALVQMSALPVTAGGKVDRRALPRHTVAPRAYREPETSVERLVAALMAEAVQQPRVGLDDDFFELGGTSLLGVTFAAKLADQTAAPITVRWVYAAPTVSSLAARITAACLGEALTVDDALGTVLPLRRGGGKTPLFCIHSAVPLAWCYAGLSRHLADRPIYGLQAPAADSLGSVADLAACYAAEVARVQPSGPYLLLGWSLGGQIAHAVAVELRRRGLPVALVVMLDSVVVPDGAPEPPTPRMRDLLTHLLGDEPGDADALPEVTAEQAAEWLSGTASLGTGLTAAQLRSLHAGYVQGVRLAHGYRPGRFDGDLLYFSATQGVTASLDSRMWCPYAAGDISEYPVDAAHAQLTNVDALAVIGRHLSALLDGRGL